MPTTGQRDIAANDAEVVLVVDDERDLTSTLAFNLNRAGYAARVAHDGKGALEAFATAPQPSLVLLDVMLPDMPGTEVFRRLREKQPGLPVIFITGLSSEMDRVVGFELGADDYVVKPFSVRELLLRIRAILRRGAPDPALDARNQVFGRLQVDLGGHRAWVDGRIVALTALELRLLGTFLERRGRVMSRGTLLVDVWGIRADLATRTVDTHVKRLRRKLGPAGDYLETLRGVGYRWVEHPDLAAGKRRSR